MAALKEVGRRVSNADYASKETKNNDSNGITISLPNHMEISIYAKTLTRVRFEVKFKKSFRTVFGRKTQSIKKRTDR